MRPAPSTSILPVLGAALLLLGCGTLGPLQEESISDRGGFPDPEQRLAAGADHDYCAAEVLRFRHDDVTESLRIADARLLLGCCGQRSLTVTHVDSLIELTERDAPDPAAGRCDPTCAYDFAVTVPGVPAGPLVLRLLRDVTDAQGGPTLVWQGELDLTAGAGEVVLDEAPAGSGCRDGSP